MIENEVVHLHCCIFSNEIHVMVPPRLCKEIEGMLKKAGFKTAAYYESILEQRIKDGMNAPTGTRGRRMKSEVSKPTQAEPCGCGSSDLVYNYSTGFSNWQVVCVKCGRRGLPAVKKRLATVNWNRMKK